MRINSVYLAGPITGLTYDGAVEWRESFTKMVNEGINCYSPMRGKHYLQSLGSIEATGLEKYGIISGGPAILTRDYSDCTNADMLVVNLLGADRVSIGTMFEIAWAHSKHIPVVLVIEDDTANIHSHSMLFAMCGYRVNNLEDAVIIVNGFFKV